MEYNREMFKIMSEMGLKPNVIHGKIHNVSPDIEWFKWLSYESEFERERIRYFDSKKVSELSYEELEEATRYNKNKVFSRLFKLYRTNELSNEDRIKVYDYMCNESIENLMLSKLTKEELRYANEEIERLSKISKDELREKVKREQNEDEYERLSMIDSYILHVISDINYARSSADLDRKIEVAVNENDAMMQKSIHFAQKH